MSASINKLAEEEESALMSPFGAGIVSSSLINKKSPEWHPPREILGNY